MTATHRKVRRADAAVRRCRKLRAERLLSLEKSHRWTTALLGASLVLEIALLMLLL